MTNEEILRKAILEAASTLGIEAEPSNITIDHSKDESHGDYATNFALKFSKIAGKKPLDFANELKNAISSPAIDRIEVAPPGFINFFLKHESLNEVVTHILKEGSAFGQGEDKGKSINVEFVSANPTGDLHLGHTRGAAFGASVSALLKKAGYTVTREFYVNDCGNQVNHLGHSLWVRYAELFGVEAELGPEDYHGQDLIKIAQEIRDKYGDKYLEETEENHAFFMRYGIDAELGKIKKDMADFGVEFDVFTYESDIRKSGKIEELVASFKEKGYAYEKDGALFLKTTSFWDDKDRPIVKANGLYTYFMPDIAYHYNKLDRGFDKIIDMLGADHHGYINRLKSALAIGGYSADKLDVEIYQIVRVYKDGEEVRMSKRTGKGIAHRDLVEWVGKDAVRYLFCEKSANTHIDFDIGLALSRTKDNPVYYAQYAYARCMSLLDMGKDIPLVEEPKDLSSPYEKEILRTLASYPEMIQGAANALAPNKLCVYIQKLAQSIHECYASRKVIDRDDLQNSGERLALFKAASLVLKDALAILGVSSPNKM